MKLKRKGLLITIVVFILVLVVARIAGIFQFYRVPTSSMEPTISAGKMFLASNLKSKERNNIVLFTRKINERFEDDPNGKPSTFCSRLIAISGDTLQVKNGYAYVNGQLADDTTQLKFSYGLSGKDFNNLMTALEIDIEKDNSANFNRMGDTAYANLSAKQYNQVKNVIHLNKQTNFMMAGGNIYPGTEWTVDDFGPYVIPPDHFFVMSDNRHNAMDSRFIGPIHVNNYTGSMFLKF